MAGSKSNSSPAAVTADTAPRSTRVRILAGAIVAMVALTACGNSAAKGPSASSSGQVSPSPTITTQPSRQPIETKVTCSSRPVTGHPLLLLQPSSVNPELAVFDLSDPLKPHQLCKLSPVNGGRFISATKIAFWSGRLIGLADLTSDMVARTAELPEATGVVFSPDGSAFAYHAGDESSGITTHINDGGTDRTLFTRAPIGGHGAPPYGPLAQMEFSADGRYLLEFQGFTPTTGPANFLVYGRDGSLAFQSTTAEFGAWAPNASKLYFLATSERGRIDGDIHSWDPSGGEVTVARGLTTYFWPKVAPDGRMAAFDSYDLSAPGEATGGLPHLWRLDLSTGKVAQLSTAISERTVFVSASVVWSDEGQRCSCGPGGASQPTGRVLSHNLVTGQDTVVDLIPSTPGSRINEVLDVWIY